MTSGCRKFYGALILVAVCGLSSAQAPKQDDVQPEEAVYELGPGITPPRVVKQVNPKYSNSSRGVRVTGSVLISLIVSSEGMPRDPRIARGIDDEVDRAALEALKQWRFAPARKNDKAIAVKVVVEIQFRGM